MTDEEKKAAFPGGLKLFSITVTYDHEGETKLKKVVNQTIDEVKEFRADVFVYGLALMLKPDHWLIVPPFDLGKIEVFLQRRWIE